MPLYSLSNVYIFKGESNFRTEPTNKILISMSTCVPSVLLEAVLLVELLLHALVKEFIIKWH